MNVIEEERDEIETTFKYSKRRCRSVELAYRRLYDRTLATDDDDDDDEEDYYSRRVDEFEALNAKYEVLEKTIDTFDSNNISNNNTTD